MRATSRAEIISTTIQDGYCAVNIRANAGREITNPNSLVRYLDGGVAPVVLDQREQRPRIRRMQPHATMRRPPNKRRDVVGAVDGDVRIEDRVRHALATAHRAVPFIRRR